MNRIRRQLAITTVFALVGAPIASAQLIQGGTAYDNVRTAGLRAPGNLVNAGLARAQENIILPFGGVEITETERPQTPKAIFLVDAIEAIFEQVDTLLFFFDNLLRARAGLPPRLPDVSVPDDSSDDGDDGRGGRR